MRLGEAKVIAGVTLPVDGGALVGIGWKTSGGGAGRSRERADHLGDRARQDHLIGRYSQVEVKCAL
jgi:hypothetical protein